MFNLGFNSISESSKGWAFCVKSGEDEVKDVGDNSLVGGTDQSEWSRDNEWRFGIISLFECSEFICSIAKDKKKTMIWIFRLSDDREREIMKYFCYRKKRMINRICCVPLTGEIWLLFCCCSSCELFDVWDLTFRIFEFVLSITGGGGVGGNVVDDW